MASRGGDIALKHGDLAQLTHPPTQQRGGRQQEGADVGTSSAVAPTAVAGVASTTVSSRRMLPSGLRRRYSWGYLRTGKQRCDRGSIIVLGRDSKRYWGRRWILFTVMGHPALRKGSAPFPCCYTCGVPRDTFALFLYNIVLTL